MEEFEEGYWREYCEHLDRSGVSANRAWRPMREVGGEAAYNKNRWSNNTSLLATRPFGLMIGFRRCLQCTAEAPVPRIEAALFVQDDRRSRPRYRALERQRRSIDDEALPAILLWEPRINKKEALIRVELTSDPGEVRLRPTQFAWFVDHIALLRRIFESRLR